MVFIDGWKLGGSVISAARWGQLGPPLPSPLHFGVLPRLGAPLGRDLVGPCAPIPFRSWRVERKGNNVGACREDTRCLSPSRRSSKPPVPPPQALCSLPCPSVFIEPASWHFSVPLLLDLLLPISGDGEKSQDVWVSLWRKDQTRYSAAMWGKSEGEEESWFCRVP